MKNRSKPARPRATRTIWPTWNSSGRRRRSWSLKGSFRRNHVDYIQMALDLDNEILKDFVDQVIDRIEILEGRVQSIRFVNGLVHEFTYSTPADLPVCQKCGGRIGSTCGCRTRTFDFAGKPYRRIKVGDPGDKFHGVTGAVCPECSAQAGRWHHWKCGIERCPICGEQLIACEHGPNGKD